jgi:hypothetical protein
MWVIWPEEFQRAKALEQCATVLVTLVLGQRVPGPGVTPFLSASGNSDPWPIGLENQCAPGAGVTERPSYSRHGLAPRAKTTRIHSVLLPYVQDDVVIRPTAVRLGHCRCGST